MSPRRDRGVVDQSIDDKIPCPSFNFLDVISMPSGRNFDAIESAWPSGLGV